MNVLIICFYVITLLILRINGIEKSRQRPFIEDVGAIEEQVQLHKNHTVAILYKKPDCSNVKARNKISAVRRPKLGLNDRGILDGTVPNRRVVKGDLVRDKLSQANGDTIIYARCSTQKSTDGYTGVSATLAVYNPEGTDINIYSAAVMRLHIGPESIEAGWRVDPKLYGDSRTHLYIYTNTRNAKCFNALCPGFIVTQKAIPVDLACDIVSKPGKDTYAVDISITHDAKLERWILKYTGDTEIGYWPNSMFELPDNVDYVEWGGEVFGSEYADMGSGLILSEDIKYDAFFSNIKVKNGPGLGGPSVDPVNLICEATSDYAAKNEGNVGGNVNYLIFYGLK